MIANNVYIYNSLYFVLIIEIVELHGGHVSMFSFGLGYGSTFVVDLPVTNLSRFASIHSLDHTTPASRNNTYIPVSLTLEDDETDSQSSTERLPSERRNGQALFKLLLLLQLLLVVIILLLWMLRIL